MRILASADLHLGRENDSPLQQLQVAVEENNPDVVVIAGDVYDYRGINPYEEFESFPCPVVFCLGNHEFADRSVEDTLSAYEHFVHSDKVTCLDISDKVTINGVTFVGNVLWYDGSLSDRENKKAYLDKINPHWLDATIIDFKPVVEHQKCVEKIKQSLDGVDGKRVLVTHMVTLKELNYFNFSSPAGWPNIYSGVKNLFETNDIVVDISICGHTHKRMTVECEYKGNKIQCYNIGNDYFWATNDLIYRIIEV